MTQLRFPLSEYLKFEKHDSKDTPVTITLGDNTVNMTQHEVIKTAAFFAERVSELPAPKKKTK